MVFFQVSSRQKILLAFLLGLLSPALSYAQLVFASSVDQGPSSVMAQRILIQAYKQLGVTLRFEALPNLRIVSMAEAGAVDGVDFRVTDTRLGDMKKIEMPVAYEELVVFSVNQYFTVSGYQSLQPYSIGYLTGARVFAGRLKGMRVDTAPSLESLFNKLQAGRTDIVVESRSSYCKARQLGLSRIRMLEPSLEKIVGYHWLSKRHGALIPRLDAVLKKMQQDDTIRKIQDETWKEFNAQCGA
ncbi:MAG: transporter substrate-binding domain-containing protein [Pseudomonadota bacterium]